MTGALADAIKETGRRRDRQINYNATHDITPESVRKNITDILESVYENDRVTIPISNDGQPHLVGIDLKTYIGDLENRMRVAASDLEFEDAAAIRDEIRKLEAMDLDLPVAAVNINPLIAAKLPKNQKRKKLNKPKRKSKANDARRLRER